MTLLPLTWFSVSDEEIFVAADNNRLHVAKANKNDEFYTSLKDIEDELVYYREHFRGKTIFLNCDDPDYSNFWRWFENRFESLKLKKLISTHYEMNGSPSYKLEMIPNPDGGAPIKNKIPLEGDGDFRSDECIELLKEADIVVTNPPFSLFREYVSQLMEYNKKFLIIGNKNAVTYKEIFPLLKDDKAWIGFRPINADMENGRHIKHIQACWFTNLDHEKRHEDLDLYRRYFPNEYPKYDNYDAIDVSEVEAIPKDYSGVMGVPITWIDKYCPEQFEIIGISKTPLGDHLRTKIYSQQIQHNKDNSKSTVTKLNDGAAIYSESVPQKRPFYEVDGKYYVAVYPRILIRNKKAKTPKSRRFRKE